jgi:penicillin amidase
MDPKSKQMLERLGRGESIASVCEFAGMSAGAFEQWWQSEIASRVPDQTGTRRAGVRSPARIERDPWGIPHIYAENDADLFFGFGYAMAQDRLFQLDYLRRKGSGRLAEILGPDGSDLDLLGRTVGFRNVFELDLLARTVGLRRIAGAEWTRLPQETRTLLTAFSAGINALMEEGHERLPIEFDLLGHEPEPWTPIDCLVIEGEFRWYLTGRFPVIVMPELARRVLGDGPLYRAFLENEADSESILPAGAYPRNQVGSQPVGTAAGDPEGSQGSNNWVVSGKRTQSGKPLLASDPHIAFDAVSCWYEVHLRGGSFNVVGMAYAGMPAVMFGRNERVAWGCTNNICSQRDLYLEKTDPSHPECFLYDGRWEPARQRTEIIRVKGGAPVEKTIRFSRNGPLIDEILPPPARGTGPVSLKWLGAYEGGWLTALLAMDRARSASDFREATRPWHVPTFNVVFADADGHIGFQSAGRIPLRRVWERGYRPGWDPKHQWDGLIPFEGMPHLQDPERGWIATANNRVAPEDFPYPLSGTWSDCLRASRIRELIEARPLLSREGCSTMQLDALALRSRRCLAGLLELLARSSLPRIGEAVNYLKGWDCLMEPDRVGATIFEVFFSYWTKEVLAERFQGETAALLTGGAGSLAAALLREDRSDWFAPGKREQAANRAINSALDWLANRLGPDLSQWAWGKLHVLTLRHVLSGRGDLGRLLDQGGQPVRGTATTVCNTAPGANFEVRLGCGYRLIADFSHSSAGLWAVDGQSQSGHPGSSNYGDQFQDWLSGRFHFLPLDRAETQQLAVTKLTLEPLAANIDLDRIKSTD